MNWLLTTILTGLTSFIATNIDDIIILMLFFSRVDRFKPRQIILGQYLGFTVLILLSLPGLLGGLFIPKIWIGLLGLIPIYIGVKELFSRDSDENEEIQLISTDTSLSKIPLSRLFSREIYSVAAVTIANGGDNIGIYVPLFASGTLVQFGVILGIFYLMLGVWCYTAFLLTRYPTLARFLTHYGEKITPWVLIGLGIFILIENETYQIIPRF